MAKSKADIGRFSERLMGMDEQAWARHANPWSGWSRVSVLPLLALSIWSRTWIGWWALAPIMLVLIWTWVNPRLFGAPKSLDNWMSQGVLGERLWLARRTAPIPHHHERAAFVLNIAAGCGLLVIAYGLWGFDLGYTIAGLVLGMGAKLWFLDRMVWLKRDTDTKRCTPTIDQQD